MAATIAKPKRKTHTKEIIGLATHTDATPPEIAKSLNITEQAVYQSLARHGIKPKRLESFKKNRADILAAYQLKILQHVDDERLKKAPAGSLILAACQLYDKERLERGQSTDNVNVLVAGIRDLQARRRGLVEEPGTE